MSGKKIGLGAVVVRYASRLRFPYLALATAILFVADLLVPDLLPFADEILLGLLTALFGTWRSRRVAASKSAASDGGRSGLNDGRESD